MEEPYLLTSDQHLHDWRAFSHVRHDGVNSRLKHILTELERAEETALTEGATKHRLAGDLFHTRGVVKPSVLNPTVEHFAQSELISEAIAGNHDLEDSYSSALGNAMEALGMLKNFEPITSVSVKDDVIMFPWFQDLNDLRAEMKKHATKEKDAIIHAPVNGVIAGIPDHGLTADELAEMGYNRVFSGHYHNHVSFCDGKVFSIGALTHQTWSDPGTKAGFMLVYPDRVEHYETGAPRFVDLRDPDDLTEELVQGNYVRVFLTDATPDDEDEAREELKKLGAMGISLVGTKKRPATREGFSAQAGKSLEVSVTEYIDAKMEGDKDVSAMALDVLSEVRAK